MPAQVEFSDDGKTACITYEGQLLLDDLRYIDGQVTPVLDRAPEPVSLIVDIRTMTGITQGILLSARNSPLFSHNNTRGIILVGGTTLFRTLADMALKLTDFKNARFAKSLDEALRISAQPED